MSLRLQLTVAFIVGAFVASAATYLVMQSRYDNTDTRVRASKLKDFTQSACPKYAEIDRREPLKSMGDFNERATDAELSQKERLIALDSCMLYENSYVDALGTVVNRITQ